MKTSIFDMNFTLPPMVEMTEVVKDIGCRIEARHLSMCYFLTVVAQPC